MADICQRCSDRGMCCRYVELPLARPLSADEITWVELHSGLRMKAADVIHIDVNCSALTPEGRCSLFGTDARPVMCSVWPDALEQVPEGCVYAEELALVSTGSGGSVRPR